MPAETISINGITATTIERSGVPSNQQLWRVRVGALILHRITSKGRREPETFIFEASEDGVIADWCELSGSCRGERSHAEAIKSHLVTIARV